MQYQISKLDKNTLRIAIPLIISNITIPLVGFVDNVMMGYLGSTIYIGAIGIGAIIISYILFSFGFIKSITTGFVSQDTGTKNDEKLLLSLFHIFLISSFISVFILIFRDYIISFALELMNTSNEVKQSSRIYLDYRIWSIPAIFLRDILVGYYIGVQKTKMAMIISIIINIVNIILDYIFIILLSLNIEGVAIASLLSEYSIILFLIYAFQSEKILKTIKIKSNLFFNWSSIKEKIAINIDMFIRSFILMTIFIYFMSTGAGYGDTTLAANTILLNFFFLFSYGIDGFAHSSEVLVGNAIGNKNQSLLKSSIFSTGKLSFFLTFMYLLFFMLFDIWIINFITSIESVNYIVLSNIFYLYMIFIFATIAFWLDGVFIGALQSKLLRNIMILAGLIFFLIETTLFGGNNQGLWLSFFIFFSLRSLFLSIALYIYLKNNKFCSV